MLLIFSLTSRISFNWSQNCGTFDVVAPLPFSVHSTGTVVKVAAPPAALRKLRITGFFDAGNAIFRLKPISREKGPYKSALGNTMARQIDAGQIFLIFWETRGGIGPNPTMEGKHQLAIRSTRIFRWKSHTAKYRIVGETTLNCLKW